MNIDEPVRIVYHKTPWRPKCGWPVMRGAKMERCDKPAVERVDFDPLCEVHRDFVQSEADRKEREANHQKGDSHDC